MKNTDNSNRAIPDPNITTLLRIGFVVIGKWKLESNSLQLIYTNDPKGKTASEGGPALYAFAVDGMLKYVGKTNRVLCKRLNEYIKPGPSQATNQKCRDLILQALQSGKAVEVYGFAPDLPFCFDEFRINLPAGLEDVLIEKMNPDWNGKQTADKTAESKSTFIPSNPTEILFPQRV